MPCPPRTRIGIYEARTKALKDQPMTKRGRRTCVAQKLIVIALILVFISFLGISSRAQEIAPPREQNQSKISYIDTHVHFMSGEPYGSGAVSTALEDHQTAARHLLRQMDEYRVEKAVILPPPQIPGQTHASNSKDLLEIVRLYPNRFVLGAGGDALNRMIHQYEPSEVTAEVRAEFASQARKLIRAGTKVFGEMAALHFSFSEGHVFEEVSPDHPLFLLLADISAEAGVPIDLHMEAVPRDMRTPSGFDRRSSNNPNFIPENISALERLLEHNGDTKIVWQHIGWDNIGYLTIDLLRKLLAAHPNLYLALRVEERLYMMSGDPMPNRIVDGDWKIRYEWAAFIEEFADRVIIGSDEFFGVPGKTRPMPQSFEETWSILNQLPADVAWKVGHETSARVYRLD
jgi:predicted TIM-barrel fold metal-dependent hydrolase